MNELDKLMAEYKPLSEPLNSAQMQALKKNVLSKAKQKKKTKGKNYKLLLLLAAAMCLLAACGAVAIGLFDSMTDVNRTAKMVEKYSLALENPPSATVDGHTVTVQAVIRSESIARLIYDVTGSKKQILNWDSFRDSEDRTLLRIQPLTNGQKSGHTDAVPGSREVGYHQLRQSGVVGKVPESNSVRIFADLDLTEDADTVSLYILSESGGAQVLQIELPEPIAEKEISLPDAVLSFRADGREAHCTIQKIRITPFRLTFEGTYEGTEHSIIVSDADWNHLIYLYDKDGEKIRAGKNGSFYGASGGFADKAFSLELDSYDLLDPAEIAEIEINGIRYPLP